MHVLSVELHLEECVALLLVPVRKGQFLEPRTAVDGEQELAVFRQHGTKADHASAGNLYRLVLYLQFSARTFGSAGAGNRRRLDSTNIRLRWSREPQALDSTNIRVRWSQIEFDHLPRLCRPLCGESPTHRGPQSKNLLAATPPIGSPGPRI